MILKLVEGPDLVRGPFAALGAPWITAATFDIQDWHEIAALARRSPEHLRDWIDQIYCRFIPEHLSREVTEEPK